MLKSRRHVSGPFALERSFILSIIQDHPSLRQLATHALVLRIVLQLAFSAAVPDRKAELVPAARAAEVLGLGALGFFIVLFVELQGSLVLKQSAHLCSGRKLPRPEAPAHAAAHADGDEACDCDGLDGWGFSLLVLGGEGRLLAVDVEAHAVEIKFEVRRRGLFDFVWSNCIANDHKNSQSVMLRFDGFKDWNVSRAQFMLLDACFFLDVHDSRAEENGEQLVQRGVDCARCHQSS